MTLGTPHADRPAGRPQRCRRGHARYGDTQQHAAVAVAPSPRTGRLAGASGPHRALVARAGERPGVWYEYLSQSRQYVPRRRFLRHRGHVQRDLAATPWLHVDYCFDPGAQMNLYIHKDDTWYELPLTGMPATQQPNIITGRGAPWGGRREMASPGCGSWRRAAARGEQTARHGPSNLKVQEIVFADWTTTPDMRAYGFGNNPGGMAARFANFLLAPGHQRPGHAAMVMRQRAFAQPDRRGRRSLRHAHPRYRAHPDNVTPHCRPGLFPSASHRCCRQPAADYAYPADAGA